jgi:alpha-ketoglutarate-dependent taurine dioxygenase
VSTTAQAIQTVTFEPIKPNIGSIVRVDRRHLTDEEVVEACRRELETRGVLVFPRAHLTDAEQLAFTDKFGARVNFTRRVPGSDVTAPDVYKITLDRAENLEPEYVLGTWFWHMDGVTIDQPLPKATMLSARRLSPSGGQTEFASTFAAWEHLPEAEKLAIAELEVIHRLEASMRPVFRGMTDEQLARYRAMAVEMIHPLVWTQRDGRKSLVIGTHADEVIGQSIPAGRSLLARLMEWAGQPDFSYRHEWQEGDFVIWNNCGVMHRVVPYDADCGRTMHRTTIMGDDRLGRALSTVNPV